MARLSQAFLSNLGRPAMTQSLFDLGTAIGNLPQQRQAQKIRQANAAELATVTDPAERMLVLAEQLERAGKTEEAASIRLKAEEVTDKRNQAQLAQIGRVAQSKSMMGRLEEALKNPSLTEARRARILDILQTAAVAGEGAIAIKDDVDALLAPSDPKAGLMVIGNKLYDAVSREEIPLGEADPEMLDLADLKQVATNESIIEYINTGDSKKLKPFVEEEDGGGKPKASLPELTARADAMLDTILSAEKVAKKYFGITYDVGKYIPWSDSRELAGYISTIQSNQAFDRLDRMRKESETGGALGQVSNIELDLLKNSLTALDPASKNFEAQLAKVKRHYEAFKAGVLNQDPPGDNYKRIDGDLYHLSGGEWYNLSEQARQQEAK